MAAKFRVHPGIGIARLGNSPSAFCIASEEAAAFPIDCTGDGEPIVKDGREMPISNFKDGKDGPIRRQAARFRVFVYDEASREGREVKIGEIFAIVDQRSGQRLTVRIEDIEWKVYLANKKASWYEFHETAGEHGYDVNHPRRNAAITDSDERRQLIIDPGARTVSFRRANSRRASFTANGGPTSFPPELKPNSIASLGDLICTQRDDHNRLLVLGGFGNSGSMLDGFGNPKIQTYANNDGWFDDVSDGPVTATFACTLLAIDGQPAPANARERRLPVDDAAWVIVAYPRYAPEVVDIVTLDDVALDIAIRSFGSAPYMFGLPPFDSSAQAPTDPDELDLWRRHARWNRDYRPYFWRDIWPILKRPLDYQLLMDRDAMSGGNPHSQDPGGNFDPKKLSIAPYVGEDPVAREQRRFARQFLYRVLRKEGGENELLTSDGLFRMPLLCGDNPLSNTAASKFFRLTNTMLFLLGQWADGLFIDEKREGIEAGPQLRGAGIALDRGALASGLGGSFCPGGEASWIIRNPAIYAAPYRIRQGTATPGALSQDTNVLSGMQPGDITKYSALPWQSDFNECTTQDIDFTYPAWNSFDLNSTGDPAKRQAYTTYWWPAHRPVWVAGRLWSPTAQNNAGDLQMVTAWSQLNFLKKTPDPDNPIVVVEVGDGSGA
jgi:hypothetical protein